MERFVAQYWDNKTVRGTTLGQRKLFLGQRRPYGMIRGTTLGNRNTIPLAQHRHNGTVRDITSTQWNGSWHNIGTME